MKRFENLGVIKNSLNFNDDKLIKFTKNIHLLKDNLKWNKEEIVDLFHYLIPDFGHKEIGKYLDSKM